MGDEERSFDLASVRVRALSVENFHVMVEIIQIDCTVECEQNHLRCLKRNRWREQRTDSIFSQINITIFVIAKVANIRPFLFHSILIHFAVINIRNWRFFPRIFRLKLSARFCPEMWALFHLSLRLIQYRTNYEN